MNGPLICILNKLKLFKTCLFVFDDFKRSTNIKMALNWLRNWTFADEKSTCEKDIAVKLRCVISQCRDCNKVRSSYKIQLPGHPISIFHMTYSLTTYLGILKSPYFNCQGFLVNTTVLHKWNLKIYVIEMSYANFIKVQISPFRTVL